MITVSNETAIKLRDAGWNAPTQYGFNLKTGNLSHVFNPIHRCTFLVDAPTLAELLNELGKIAQPTLFLHPNKKYWHCSANHGNKLIQAIESSVVEAAAQVWLDLNSGVHEI